MPAQRVQYEKCTSVLLPVRLHLAAARTVGLTTKVIASLHWRCDPSPLQYELPYMNRFRIFLVRISEEMMSFHRHVKQTDVLNTGSMGLDQRQIHIRAEH